MGQNQTQQKSEEKRIINIIYFIPYGDQKNEWMRKANISKRDLIILQ